MHDLNETIKNISLLLRTNFDKNFFSISTIRFTYDYYGNYQKIERVIEKTNKN